MKNRRTQMLDAALVLSEKQGYKNLTREQIGVAAGVTGPLLNHHFEGMEGFRRELVEHAIAQKHWPVITQSIVCGECPLDPSDPLRVQALKTLS